MINWGESYPDDADKSDRAPKYKLYKSYKLHFGSNTDLSMCTKSKVIGAYYHNKDQRATLLYRGTGAFTFEIQNARTMEKKANYEGVCKKIKFKAEIMFKDQGKKLEGTGRDQNQKDFKIEGTVVQGEEG